MKFTWTHILKIVFSQIKWRTKSSCAREQSTQSNNSKRNHVSFRDNVDSRDSPYFDAAFSSTFSRCVVMECNNQMLKSTTSISFSILNTNKNIPIPFFFLSCCAAREISKAARTLIGTSFCVCESLSTCDAIQFDISNWRLLPVVVDVAVDDEFMRVSMSD